jgi:hypothetical protein
MEDILAITFLFGGGAVFLLSISPVGRAIADRIRRGAHGVPHQDLERLREVQAAMYDEVETLRNEVAELREQVDFTERMLARQRSGGHLLEGGDADVS